MRFYRRSCRLGGTFARSQAKNACLLAASPPWRSLTWVVVVGNLRNLRSCLYLLVQVAFIFCSDDINLLVAEITLALFEITPNLFEITLLAFEITPLIKVLSFIAFCGAKSHGFGQLGFKVLGELLLNGCEFPYYGDELLAKLDEFPANHCEFPQLPPAK